MKGRPAPLRAIIFVALVLCVLLAFAVGGAIRYRQVENAKRSPWAKQGPGVTFVLRVEFAENGKVQTGERSYRLVSRTTTTAHVRITDVGPGRSFPGRSVEDIEYTMGVDDALPEDQGEPHEKLVTSQGTFDCRRVEGKSGTAHTTLWLADDLPVPVKAIRAHGDRTETDTLVKISRP